MFYLAIVFLFVVKFMWKNAACILVSEIFPDIGNFSLILWVAMNSHVHVQVWSFWGVFFCLFVTILIMWYHLSSLNE